MTYLKKSLLHGAGIAAVMLIFAGCEYNPSFRAPDSNHDGIRYGFEEQGEGWFEWNITFDSSVGVVQTDKSSLQLRLEGGDDVLELEDGWLKDSGAQGTSKLLQAGVYYLRLMLAKEDAYILVVQPIAIHRGQTTKFEQTYTDKHFKPFTLLQVNVQATSAVPIKLEEAKLEFFSVELDGVLSVPLLQTNGKGDVRLINMKELGRNYLSEGWTALPQNNTGNNNTDFWIRLTIRDAKGRHFIRTSKGYSEKIQQTITVNWEPPSSESINLLNPVVFSKVPTDTNGEFTFTSVGTDGKEYRGEEYGGAEPGCEVRIVAKPKDNNHVLQWIQVLSNPWLELSEKLVHNGEFGYFTFKMPKTTIQPFEEIKNIYKEKIDPVDKNAVIVTGEFIKLSGVALLNNPGNTTFSLPVENSFVHFEERDSLEHAIDAASINEQNTIVIRRDLDAFNNDKGSAFITSTNTTITIPNGKNIALIPQPEELNSKTITIKRTKDDLSNLFTVAGTLTIGINKDTGAAFTFDGGGFEQPLISIGGSGTLEIQGGTFKGSNSTDAAISSKGGTFKMSGGTIEDNKHALSVQNTVTTTLSGSASIPYTGTLDSPGNDIVMYSDTEQITVSGALTGLSKGTPAVLTKHNGEWGADRSILLKDTGINYEKFKVTTGKDTAYNNAEMHYTINSKGELYGPQAYINGSNNNRTYYLRLDKAFEAAPPGANIYLLKNIRLGEAGNEALTVTRDSYITTPVGKTINLISDATQHFTISRADSTAKTLFTVTWSLNLNKVTLDGEERPNSPPMVIVESGNASNTTLLGVTNNSQIINHRGGTGIGDAALNVKNGAEVSLLGSVMIKNNQRNTGSGGAIYNSGGIVKIFDDVTLENNTASNGGAIYNNSGTVMISGTVTLKGNEATGGNGGAIYNNGGKVTIEKENKDKVKFQKNTATGNGGAIYNNSGTEVKISGAEMSGNEAAKGGAIYTILTQGVSITDVTLQNNNATATGDYSGGGALYNSGGTVTISGTLERNDAANGGAIYTDKGTVNVSSTLSDNKATGGGNGGAIYNNGGTVTTSGKLERNDAANGGAIYNNGGTVTTSGTLEWNTAIGSGGAIYNNNGTVKISGVTLQGNTAYGSGGAIYNSGGTVETSGSVALDYNNASVGNGSGIYQNGTFKIPGKFDSNNDIFLPSGRTIDITSFSGAGQVTITPQSPRAGLQVLSGDKTQYTKFTVNNPLGGTTWTINAQGQLEQPGP